MERLKFVGWVVFRDNDFMNVLNMIEMFLFALFVKHYVVGYYVSYL